MLPAKEVPHLVDSKGMFRSDMAGVGAVMFFNGAARRELAAEITAQFEAFRATGLTLDHCNAHKHFHLHPVIGRLMVKIGRRFGLRAARIPLEPRAVLRDRAADAIPLALLTAPFAFVAPTPRRGPHGTRFRVRSQMVGTDEREPPLGPHSQPARGPQRDLSSSGHRPLRWFRKRLSLPGGVRGTHGSGNCRGGPGSGAAARRIQRFPGAPDSDTLRRISRSDAQ